MRSFSGYIFVPFVLRQISIQDTEISAAVSPESMENGKAKPVGRETTPSPALVLLLTMKKI